MSRPRPIVAIDGPAGAGKSTVAHRLAQVLGFTLLDTGSLYRAVALQARRRGIDWEDEEALAELAGALRFHFVGQAEGPPRIEVDGEDCSAAIRTQEIATGASRVSRHPALRQALLEPQRSLAREGGVVMEGRDIGTVVFPDAEFKFFLTASLEVRAERRQRDLQARGRSLPLEEVREEVRSRDQRDEKRAVAPLRPAEDAEIIDTGQRDIEGLVALLAEKVRSWPPARVDKT